MAIKFLVKDDAIERTRVALGGMAEIPKRANCLEKMLVINRTKTDIAKLAYAELKKDFSPISDVRGSAGYRLQVAANLVKKTLLMEHSKSDINIVDLSDDAIISGSQ
jgi:xanthine dehydrogenase small subunit